METKKIDIADIECGSYKGNDNFVYGESDYDKLKKSHDYLILCSKALTGRIHDTWSQNLSSVQTYSEVLVEAIKQAEEL